MITSFKYLRTGNVYYPFFLFLLFGLMSCQQQKKKIAVQWQGGAFGTTYHISIVSDSALVVTQTEIDSVLNEVNQVFSTYQPNTYIQFFNLGVWDSMYRADEEKFKAHQQEFFKLYQLSRRIYSATEGAFDPSAGPLFNLWGFAESKERQNPTQYQIDSILSFVGMNLFSRVDNIVLKPNPSSTLNFNAIAKGHGVDRVAQYLEFNGIDNYMVEIGGEVRCKGLNKDGDVWKIGINAPVKGAATNSLYGVVEVENQSLATSGNYRNFYTDSTGNIIGHTINPKIGRPSLSDILSASVLAPSCAEADAYATAFMVLGKEKSIEIVENDSTLSTILIYKKDGVLKDTTVGQVILLR